MNEHKLYLENKIGWVMFLMAKYLSDDKFKPVIELVASLASEEDKAAARQAWKDYRKV
jgi:hypothetical protein